MPEENRAILRQAYEAYRRGDMTKLATLIHPGLERTYLDPSSPDPQPQTCYGRQQLEQVIASRAGRATAPELTEAVVSGDKAMVAVRGPGTGRQRTGPDGGRSYLVVTFRQRRIVAVRACRSRDEACRLAGIDPATPVLAPPTSMLNDGVVTVRPFAAADLAAFESAGRPGGNEGTWLIPVSGGPRQWLAAHVGSWPAGWPVGPALAVARAADGLLVGVIYLAGRGAGSVGLAYGVAPAHRGRGVATRAVRLAAAWLLGEGGWHRVELLISEDAAASQRVAVKAGFRLAGRIRTREPATGEEFEDRLYVLTAGHTSPAPAP
jgi:RimJ/RimL family protein N-acetyltransferase/ketosteroid isomerase-like protein